MERVFRYESESHPAPSNADRLSRLEAEASEIAASNARLRDENANLEGELAVLTRDSPTVAGADGGEPPELDSDTGRLDSGRDDTRGALPTSSAVSGDDEDDDGAPDARQRMVDRQKDAWKTLGGRRPLPPGAGADRLPPVGDPEGKPFIGSSRSTHVAGQEPIDQNVYTPRARQGERRQAPAFTEPLNDPDTGMGNDARDAMAKRQFDAGRTPLRRDRGLR
jgi:hypothetical protein